MTGCVTGRMTGQARFCQARVWSLVVLAMLLGMASATAQSAGADEGITPRGAVTPAIAFTPEQRSAIYNAVLRQRAQPATAQIEPTVGAVVPRSAQLAELPAQTGIVDADFLKYAMVADDVVVVDPIKMRVIDVIHGNVGL